MAMAALLSIGEFSRLTHVSVKALRHYHDLGLLEPAAIDPETGYRSYATAQVPVALVIRRFRELDMPLEEVRKVLQAADVGDRDAAIGAHLQRMEQQLQRTQDAVASLRELLDGATPTPSFGLRTIQATTALAAREVVAWEDVEAWLIEVFAEIDKVAGSGGSGGIDDCWRNGPSGALYGSDLFEAHVGEVVAFVPLESPPPSSLRPTGRIELVDIPGGRYAVTVHHGPFTELDRTYGALGTFVAERAIAAPGPIRENYLVTPADTLDPRDLRTEVCWPVTQAP
jgi:DNA-binding transcriptional MerR regulator